MIKVRVPATSANIGAGFDCIGIALTMYNYAEFEENDGIEIISEDDNDVPTDESNMIYSSAKAVYDECGTEFRGLRIRQSSNIPMTRGLGSSSACLVAGLVGANELLGRPLGNQHIIDLAAELEGHPDNTTPAVVGGFVTAVLNENGVYYKRQTVSDNIGFTAMVPPFTLSTEYARSVLPKTYTREDAVYNISRAALLASSLPSGDVEGIRAAIGDRMHEQYRIGLIKDGQAVLNTAKDAGAYGVFISGAGPTIIAIHDSNDIGFAKRTEEMLKSSEICGWTLHTLECDLQGVSLC